MTTTIDERMVRSSVANPSKDEHHDAECDEKNPVIARADSSILQFVLAHVRKIQGNNGHQKAMGIVVVGGPLLDHRDDNRPIQHADCSKITAKEKNRFLFLTDKSIIASMLSGLNANDPSDENFSWNGIVDAFTYCTQTNSWLRLKSKNLHHRPELKPLEQMPQFVFRQINVHIVSEA